MDDLARSVRDGYDRWAVVYDHDANPMVALEESHVRELVGEVRGRQGRGLVGVTALMKWALALVTR